jgi:broad specificity phosphatase PhoE
VPFEHIYASDLKRATMTAQAVHAGQAANPKPPLTRTAAIREQHWGIAEGKPWVMHTTPGKSIEQHFAEGIYPVLFGPEEKFPNGESKVDLGKRATQAVKQLVIPHVYQVARTGERRVHIAVVSHGLCISELVPALLKWGPYVKDEDFSGLKNTAWTRVEVALKASFDLLMPPQA